MATLTVETLSFVTRILIGLLALIVSVPFVIVAMLFVLGGSKKADSIYENSPLWVWLDYMEKRK